jgi:hypothetical protein
MFPKDTQEECDKIKQMFIDIERILNDKGIYCCISLLQSHILRELLAFFTERNYIIEINEFFLKKSKLFPYFVTLRKVDQPNGDKVVLNLKSEECNNVQLTKKEVCAKINALQTYAFFMSDIKTLKPSLRVSIDIWDHTSNSKIPKYTIIICDSPNLKVLEKVKRITMSSSLRKPVDASLLLKEENQATSQALNKETSTSLLRLE